MKRLAIFIALLAMFALVLLAYKAGQQSAINSAILYETANDHYCIGFGPEGNQTVHVYGRNA